MEGQSLRELYNEINNKNYKQIPSYGCLFESDNTIPKMFTISKDNIKELVLQHECILKKDKENNYFDIAVYVSDKEKTGKVEGYISRTSKNKVVNVGNGGFLKPVVLKTVELINMTVFKFL